MITFRLKRISLKCIALGNIIEAVVRLHGHHECCNVCSLQSNGKMNGFLEKVDEEIAKLKI